MMGVSLGIKGSGTHFIVFHDTPALISLFYGRTDFFLLERHIALYSEDTLKLSKPL